MADAGSSPAGDKAPIGKATIVGTTALFIVLSTLFTAARMYTRFTVHQQFWWDDWAMATSWIFTMALCALAVDMGEHGGGRSISDVPEQDLSEFSKAFLDLQPVARVAIFFAKLSILLLYIRVFYPKRVRRNSIWWTTQAVIVLNLLYTIALILLVTLQCVPYGRPWGDSCVNEWLVLVLSSIINIVSDIAVLVIPMASVWSLQMNRNKKLAIWALFAFGALAPVASIARLIYQVIEARGKNETVIYTIVAILATTEQVIAIIVGCAPVVSAWVLKGARRTRLKRPGNRTMTERFWPNRESEEPEHPSIGLRMRRLADPFPVTSGTLPESEEVLCS
ncbi:hypothetical protein M426DRAFT_21178 [Hypoxylon sp. CI-4A]|nr:hypothetical protein M426DRAFT_21178 [Hypoxylon sp. CI-4A]